MKQMPGCPFNDFGPCREEACSFFFEEKDALRVLTLLLPKKEQADFIADRCVIWLNFLGAQEVLGASRLAERETDRIVAARQEYLVPGGVMFPELHFRMLEGVLDRLERLELLCGGKA